VEPEPRHVEEVSDSLDEDLDSAGAEAEAADADQADEDDTAPVLAVPKFQWECQHCTFINKSGTRVCAVCCKTTDRPKRPASQEWRQERERERSRRLSLVSHESATTAPVSGAKSTASRQGIGKGRRVSDSGSGVATSNGDARRRLSEQSQGQLADSSYDYSDVDTHKMAERLRTKLKVEASSKREQREQNEPKKKGRIRRRISFWPGTKT